MLLSEKKLDELVPVPILEQFGRDFINGFVKLMVLFTLCILFYLFC